MDGVGLTFPPRPKDGLALFDAIKNEMPDVVVIDAIMPNLDAIELMKKIMMSVYKKPIFIVVSTYDNPFIEKQAMENGASYFMLKPFEVKTLGERILSLTGRDSKEEQGINFQKNAGASNLEVIVTDIIHQT